MRYFAKVLEYKHYNRKINLSEAPCVQVEELLPYIKEVIKITEEKMLRKINELRTKLDNKITEKAL